MLHLIAIEILKLKRNRPFLILTVLFAISIFGANYIGSEITAKSPFNVYKFPGVWSMVSFVSSFLIIIPCFTIIMHTCSEYTYRTHRQNIIDGLSRSQYITAKLLIVAALALLSTALTAVCAFVIGLNGDMPVAFNGIKYIFYFFIQTVTYLEISFLLALVLKKSALTIGLFFTYSLVIENILELYLNKIFNRLGFEWAENLGHLLPLSSSDHLLVPDSIKTAVNIANMGAQKPEYVYLAASIAYIVLCGAACYYRYKKQDL
jgi:ABC-type transport system involved in multi-copper enzyme maturation permease subunit